MTTYIVQTVYGTVTAATYTEAKMIARDAAAVTGKVATVKKVAEVVEATVAAHEVPCVCGTYDRCWGQRVKDAQRATTQTGAFRALHRAYND